MTDLEFLKVLINKKEPTLSDVLQGIFSFSNKKFYVGNRVDAFRLSITAFQETCYWDLSKNLLSEQSEETIKILAYQFQL